MGRTIFVALSLLRREVVRFVRQRNRIIGALGTPLVFWFLIGSGLRDAFAGAVGLNYLQYFFPGSIALMLLFTAIFSTISVIEDRQQGFLQGILVAPVSRSALALGNILGGTTLATCQGLLMLVLVPVVGAKPGLMGLFTAVTAMVLVSFSLTALGFIMAWRLDTTQGFHALMNLFLMPLWMLSGALFPVKTAPAWLQVVMAVNPVSYSVAALQKSLFPVEMSGSGLPSVWISLGVSFIFAVVMFFLAVATAQRNRV